MELCVQSDFCNGRPSGSTYFDKFIALTLSTLSGCCIISIFWGIVFIDLYVCR